MSFVLPLTCVSGSTYLRESCDVITDLITGFFILFILFFSLSLLLSFKWPVKFARRLNNLKKLVSEGGHGSLKSFHSVFFLSLRAAMIQICWSNQFFVFFLTRFFFTHKLKKIFYNTFPIKKWLVYFKFCHFGRKLRSVWWRHFIRKIPFSLFFFAFCTFPSLIHCIILAPGQNSHLYHPLYLPRSLSHSLIYYWLPANITSLSCHRS
jgi:hypothetical protein